MKTAEKSARTVEDAIAACLAELGGVSEENVEIEILEEAGKGLFGLFGGRQARVRVTVPENGGGAMPESMVAAAAEGIASVGADDKEETVKRWKKPTAESDKLSPEEKTALNTRQAEIAQDLLEKILAEMAVEADMEIFYREDNARIMITGEDIGVLIGRRGETMDALQFLLNLAVSRQTGMRSRIFLDIAGYRQRREETLINLARRLAEKVKRTNSRVTLEPMPPRERRIIHLALQGDWKLTTFSEGDEPNRRVVIAPKRRAD
ncbi:MAG: protein jag [Gracilibacteraceae bacterium]|jgi:spoIIIJ-associated protein|nr:protein jag [Gracilibacteraceae bacterium]